MNDHDRRVARLRELSNQADNSKRAVVDVQQQVIKQMQQARARTKSTSPADPRGNQRRPR